MRFIGRQSELAKLQEEHSNGSSFVILYGRRRVGKTTLIKEFLKDKLSFYFLATEELEKQSMKRFSGVIARATGNALLERASFSDWMDLFQLVADYQPETKKVLVIDEFPYLVKSNPAFPSILQHAWDELLKEKNVMLILCGSLIGMMQKHALSYDSPLYGRRTSQMRLRPLTFSEIYETQNLSFEESVEQYAITGGVPKYMEFFENAKPLNRNIQETILSKSGFLYEEPYFLLKSESLTAVNYFSIIKTIADGNHKFGKIAGVLEQDSPSLSPYMALLADLGFIEKRTPITEKNPEKSRKGLYFISDNFIRFWFHYVYPFRGELELDNTQIVFDEMQKDFIKTFVPFVYEDVCQNIFAKLCQSGSIPFNPSRIGSYWLNDYDSDTQIDVMAVDNRNMRVFAGECKYHKKPVDAPDYFDLKTKVEESGEIQNAFPEYEVYYGVFSKSGFTKRLTELAECNDHLFLIQEDHLL